MNAVILAAGIGSRLRPLTIDQPKACLTVDGTPIGEHQFRAYAAAGIDDGHCRNRLHARNHPGAL